MSSASPCSSMITALRSPRRACCAGRISMMPACRGKLGMPRSGLKLLPRQRIGRFRRFLSALKLHSRTLQPIGEIQDLLTPRELGAHALATGHYVRRLQGRMGPTHRARDPERDQSYFLSPRHVSNWSFFAPSGDLPKRSASLGERFGNIADKPDSQDICFMPNGSYAGGQLRQCRRSGQIVDLEGRVLGAPRRHHWLHRGTAPRHWGGGGDQPLYIVRLEPEARRVVGPRAALRAIGLPARSELAHESLRRKAGGWSKPLGAAAL